MPDRSARRLLIVGWDAADWKIIDPLLAQGALPALASIIQRGVRADLHTLEPKLSPILWTSIATGKTADKHGILNFLEPDPASHEGAVRPVASTSRKTKALWNILTQSGLRTNVVGWYASHPAEPIRGACISNIFQEGVPASPTGPWPIPKGSIHPADLDSLIAPLRVHPTEKRSQELLAMVPMLSLIPVGDKRIATLVKLIARCISLHRTAVALLKRDTSWDCSMVFYDTIDVVGHHFMQYHPPRMRHVPARDFELFKYVMNATYRLQDSMLAALLKLAGPDATVILLSDHGFHSDHLRPAVQAAADDEHAAMDATWHRPLGVLAMAGPGIRKGAPVAGASLLDITPSALSLLGLPRGADMDGRVLSEAMDNPPAIDPIPSWDAAEGAAGLHPPDLRQDPFEAREAIAQLVELGYVAPLSGDASAMLELVKRETRFNLAVVYMTTGRVAEALPIFEELARSHPDEPRYVLGFSRCCADRSLFAQARDALTGYVRAHPSDPDAQMCLATTLFAEGRLEEAAALLGSLLPGAPIARRPEVQCLLGTVHIFQRRPDDAAREFAAALQIDPHSPHAHHGLALAELVRRRFEDAAGHCLDALALMQSYPDAHYTLGAALAWMNDLDHATQSFLVAIAYQPGMLEAHRFLAAIYSRQGESSKAAHHQGIVQRLAPGPDEARGTLLDAPMGPREWSQSR